MALVVVSVLVGLGGVLVLPAAAVGAADGDGSGVSVVRYGGADRYETSLKVAEAVAADAGGSLEWVVVVSGRRWTDAVVAAPVAGALGAPVLMTLPGELRADALEFLERVGVSKALVVGPEASGGAHGPGRGVAAGVLEALSEAGISTDRIAGGERYGTAVAAAGRVTPGVMGVLGRTAVIANSDVFADALVAGPFAARGVHPVLLSPPEELHPDVAGYLGDAAISHVVLMGGTAALNQAVEQSVKDLGIKVTRVAGATRYDTAAKAADLAADQYSTAAGQPCFATSTVGLARARVPFDSFSAAPLLGRLCAPLLLADPDNIPTDTAAYLDTTRKAHDTVELRVFGGDKAVSQSSIDTHLAGENEADDDRTAPLWRLRGTVDHGWAEPLASGRDVVMASDIEGAVVEIVDGPNAGRKTVTDKRGRWTLQGLDQARVTVRVTAEGFVPAERTVDLTADTELPFAVSRRLPRPGTPGEFPDTDPEYIQALVSHYPYVHRVGNVRVFSDISAEFSREHAEHAWNVWAFFDDLYAANRGDYLDAYYTTDLGTFLRLRPHCRADLWHQYSLTNDTRVVTACYLDYPRSFIIPYQTPDFGTQLHEFGHDFLFAVWPAWDDYKWFIEGTAQYFEGGVFSDTLRVPKPIGYCSDLFDQWDQQDRLIPLGELLRLDGAAYLADNHRTYPLSCMLFHYLERHHPGVLYSLIEQINSRQITTNDRLIDLMLELTGMSVSELEETYTNYARQASK